MYGFQSVTEGSTIKNKRWLNQGVWQSVANSKDATTKSKRRGLTDSNKWQKIKALWITVGNVMKEYL